MCSSDLVILHMGKIFQVVIFAGWGVLFENFSTRKFSTGEGELAAGGIFPRGNILWRESVSQGVLTFTFLSFEIAATCDGRLLKIKYKYKIVFRYKRIVI